MTAKDLDYWFPHSPARYKRLTMHLTPMQDLIFRRLRDYYMAEHKGPLPDHPQALANIVRLPIDEFSLHFKDMDSLFKKCNENNNPNATGFLRIADCEGMLADQTQRRNKNVKNGQNGGRKKTNKNNVEKPRANPNASTIQDNTVRESSVEDSPRRALDAKASTPPSDIVKAFTMFNEAAERCGIPKAQRLNKTREGRLAARLRDIGGLEGWAGALAKMEESDFCTGRKTDFKASLDFILQDSSFTKLMEGNYDNGPRHNGTKNRNGNSGNELDGFDLAADKIARNGQRDRNVQAGPDAPGDLFAERPRARNNTPD